MSSLTLSKEEEKRLKGLGFLNNKGTDNFSARILTVNGLSLIHILRWWCYVKTDG